MAVLWNGAASVVNVDDLLLVIDNWGKFSISEMTVNALDQALGVFAAGVQAILDPFGQTAGEQ